MAEISRLQPPLFFCFACRRRGLSFTLFISPTPSSPNAPCALAPTHQSTNLGHRVAAVLGVARTLLVRRLDDEADGARGGDDRRSAAGAVEAGASGPGRRRGQARRPDEGGGEHSLLQLLRFDGLLCVRSTPKSFSREDEKKKISDSKSWFDFFSSLCRLSHFSRFVPPSSKKVKGGTRALRPLFSSSIFSSSPSSRGARKLLTPLPSRWRRERRRT